MSAVTFRAEGGFLGLHPFAEVKITCPAAKRFVTVKALIDTGAMGLGLSALCAEKLKLEAVDRTLGTVMGGATIETGRAPVILAWTCVQGRTQEFEVIAHIGAVPSGIPAVIGMEILNCGVLTVDGPAQKWSFDVRPADSPKP